MKANWPPIKNLERIASPGLLVDAGRVEANIQRLISIVGGRVSRLRPHLKTHKMPEVVRRFIAAGITQFKAATVAEAAMAADAGANAVLLAYQPVGPNIGRLASVAAQHPNTRFSAITDDISAVQPIASAFGGAAGSLDLFIDVDCGMHRTGIPLGSELDRLRARIEAIPGVAYAGLHVYDGHLHAPSVAGRHSAAREIIDQIRRYEHANPSPAIVAGGSPTLATWAQETPWQCSPGTTVFWDVGYGDQYPDLEFSIAAALLTRVISKPGGSRVCLDLGYKAIASEMPLKRRVVMPAISDAALIAQSEEHLVIQTADAAKISIGQTFLAFPRHICPTVALHAFATVVRHAEATAETWCVAARDR